jgi:hypothetical protein
MTAPLRGRHDEMTGHSVIEVRSAEVIPSFVPERSGCQGVKKSR